MCKTDFQEGRTHIINRNQMLLCCYFCLPEDVLEDVLLFVKGNKRFNCAVLARLAGDERAPV